MFAKIVVDIKSDNLNETYDYLIPDSLCEFVGVGSRVIVPFGRQEVLGYVLEINEFSDFKENVKEIKEVLDYDKELTSDQLELAKYISSKYYVSLPNVLELMIPSFLKGQKRKYIEIKDYDALNPELAILFNGKTRFPMDKVVEEKFDLIKKEINKKNITIDYDLYTYGNGFKKKLYYVEDLTPVFKSEKRKNIYEYVQTHPGVEEDDIITYVDCTYNLIREMLKDSTLRYKEVVDINQEEEILKNKSNYEFSFDQEQTIKKYYSSIDRKFLLHSNDEEFKLNFYINIITECKKRGFPVIITAPTIMLVEEILMYLKRYLSGYKIYGMNSKISRKERYEAFMNAKYDNLDCLVTTHNGLFMPFNKIGAIIVVDEENPNYINENYPYYDAVDVLQKRAEMFNADFVLSTSTPSIKTYYKAINGEYSVLNANLNVIDKNVTIVSKKSEILEGSNLLITNTLKEKMESAFIKHKQVMLLVSTKAYSTYLRCRECGKVIKCPKCNLSLTLYKEKGYAKCNYCDYKLYEYEKCKCGGEVLPHLNGEEALDEELKELFPDKRIVHVNADLMKTSVDYNKLLNDIEENNVDIIVGTNILSKTIKADNIEVVGIIDADMYLNTNNYHANEYTYNLIAKLNNKKEVVIQTNMQDNNIIRYASKNNYYDYYKEEIGNRSMLNYDPFNEVNRITITGEYKEMYHAANYFKKIFTTVVKGDCLGPTYDNKLKGVKLILKHNDYDKIIRILTDTISYFKKVRVQINYERCPKVI